MIFAHKIELDPTFSQRDYFSRATGTARFTWNWALAEWNRQHAAGEKPSWQKLKREFNAVKYDLWPWMSDIARDPHAAPFQALGGAFQRFFKKQAKRPKFKKKGRCRESFAVANDQFSVDGDHIRLPRIGWIRMTESLRFVGKIMGAVVSRAAGRWFVSISVEVASSQKPRTGDGDVGVDLGIKSAVTLSTGGSFDSPKPLKAGLQKLRRLAKAASRKVKGSSNRRKAIANLARCHYRISCIRKDWLHKITTKLCRENQTVCLEDLNVSGMIRNRKLARAISDIGWSEFRRQIEYKSIAYGTSVSIVDRFFPSSKTCSQCSHVADAMPLSQRVYHCGQCGLVLDRDVNAAINIKTAGLAGLACGSFDNPTGSDSSRAERVEAGTKTRSLVSTN